MSEQKNKHEGESYGRKKEIHYVGPSREELETTYMMGEGRTLDQIHDIHLPYKIPNGSWGKWLDAVHSFPGHLTLQGFGVKPRQIAILISTDGEQITQGDLDDLTDHLRGHGLVDEHGHWVLEHDGFVPYGGENIESNTTVDPATLIEGERTKRLQLADRRIRKLSQPKPSGGMLRRIFRGND